MRAVYIAEFGGPEHLEIRDLPEPRTTNEREIIVRVYSAGLNRADLLQSRGLYPPPEGTNPLVPGLEFAGEVIACGRSAARFSPGDRVFGITSGEAQAEVLCVDERLASRIPEGLSFFEAAAVPEAFVVSCDALVSQADVKSGETVLVHAAGSGVGLAAVQLAKAKGATVFGTSRTPEKLERCRDYGLDEGFVVGKEASFAETVLKKIGGKGVDVILDLVGAPYFEQNLRCLAVKGRLLLVGLTGGSRSEIDLGTVLRKRLRITGTVLRSRSIDEKSAAIRVFDEQVVPMFEKGVLKPVVDRVFKLSDVRSAYEFLGSNRGFGKVLLDLG